MQLIYGVHLFNYRIGNIVISDIFLFLLLVYVLFKEKRINFSKNNVLLIAFIIIMVVSSLMNINSPFFELPNYLSSCLKLLFYACCFILIPPYLSKKPYQTNRIIIRSLIAITVLGVYQLIAHYCFPFLPYSLTNDIISTRVGYDPMFSYGGQFRIKSIYSEPAHLAIYINLLYGYVLHNEIRINKWVHILVVFTIMMTYSMSGIVLLVLNYTILAVNRKMLTLKSIKYLAISVIPITFVISSGYILNRIDKIIMLTEGSGTRRLLGGFELIQYFPFYGVGLGNLESFYSNLNVFFYYATGWQIHNIIPIIIGSGGWIALLMFLLFVLSLYKLNNGMSILLVGSFFAWGYFIATPFWFYLILLKVNCYQIPVGTDKSS